MPLTIKKHYEENVQIGDFKFAKVGLEIASDKAIANAAELEEVSGKLNQLAKTIVRKELQQIKEERRKR